MTQRAPEPEGEQPFAEKEGRLPDGWRVAPLGKLCTVVNGGTPSTRIPGYWNGSIPWCTPTDVTQSPPKYLKRTERTITEAGLRASGATLVPAGAILLCSRATVGEVRIAASPVATNQGFKTLVCSDAVDSEFIYYTVLTLKPKLLQRAIGSTFREVSKRDVEAIPIVLPPLPEQRRMVVALSEADDLLGALDALIAKKRAAKLGATQALLSRRTRLPGFAGDWARHTLRDLGVFLRGSGIRRHEMSEDGAGCVRYGEIYTTYGDYFHIPASRASLSAAKWALPVQKGDLLFAATGETAEEIGKCVAYLGDQIIYAGGDVVVLRAPEQDAIFLAHLLNSPDVVRQKARLAQGDIVVHLHARQLATVEVSVPEPMEQRAIAALLRSMDQEIEALEAQLRKARSLRSGMLRALLTGGVRLSELKAWAVTA